MLVDQSMSLDSYLDGNIDNVSIWDRILSLEEIQTIDLMH